MLLGLREQRTDRLGDIGQAEVGRLLHPLPVALELAGLQLEISFERGP